ncbi:hypothetical protein [Methylobacterium nigriterrae]|uniref:hypothetical protein n=1 Tax=Methylobacterium nigriterrae TaxID=3127512 RepID=UPI00301336E9
MMLVLDQANDHRPGQDIWFPGDIALDAEAVGTGACLHDRAAWATALDDGLLSEEIRQVLAGRRMLDAFPIRFGENPQAYATRAVAEMIVAYLS